MGKNIFELLGSSEKVCWRTLALRHRCQGGKRLVKKRHVDLPKKKTPIEQNPVIEPAVGWASLSISEPHIAAVYIVKMNVE